MKYRILYVEDEQILGQLVRESLEKQNYEVLLITNGFDALKAFRDFDPHLCLLDIMLPGKDGYDVAKQLRALNKKIPILFLTAKVMTQDLITGFNAGGNDYIRKPFSMDEITARINNWLQEKYGQPNEPEAACYTSGGFCFYPQQQLLSTPSGTVTLTFKEAAILGILFAHRNTIITRDHLQQKIWGNDTIYNSRTLDVYINRLRKHFTGSPNRIITLKGVGYKFIAE